MLTLKVWKYSIFQHNTVKYLSFIVFMIYISATQDANTKAHLKL